jgi:hypothetical protein
MKLLLLIVYILLLVFVLAVIFLKIIRKEKIHQVWFWGLGLLIVLPVLCFIFVNFFSATPPVEVLQQIP